MPQDSAEKNLKTLKDELQDELHKLVSEGNALFSRLGSLEKEVINLKDELSKLVPEGNALNSQLEANSGILPRDVCIYNSKVKPVDEEAKNDVLRVHKGENEQPKTLLTKLLEEIDKIFYEKNYINVEITEYCKYINEIERVLKLVEDKNELERWVKTIQKMLIKKIIFSKIEHAQFDKCFELSYATLLQDALCRITDKENATTAILQKKHNRVLSLLKNENFISMCKEIDRLEKYGNDLCPRFFTVGTKKAKNDCVELVSELKTLVTSFVFEKDEVYSKSNVIRLKLEASFEKMQHRNVFSIVAKSVLYIFECMWLCFSGGYRPDFFRTERKVIGESLIAYSDGCYKQLQGITPPDVPPLQHLDDSVVDVFYPLGVEEGDASKYPEFK